ncbi:hypothetical protein BB560_006553 [Smittium megazygosporum]|uniref:Centrosomin N-terminal motif 1 domain-containing protein n=1 Tax=Smittium megazygosporum TaxID=133381 RepID=A0A2T9Y479_9FUNG|nr:hypothetical protein BB560_006553 [Smittium megazygosporum]
MISSPFPEPNQNAYSSSNSGAPEIISFSEPKSEADSASSFEFSISNSPPRNTPFPIKNSPSSPKRFSSGFLSLDASHATKLPTNPSYFSNSSFPKPDNPPVYRSTSLKKSRVVSNKNAPNPRVVSQNYPPLNQLKSENEFRRSTTLGIAPSRLHDYSNQGDLSDFPVSKNHFNPGNPLYKLNGPNSAFRTGFKNNANSSTQNNSSFRNSAVYPVPGDFTSSSNFNPSVNDTTLLSEFNKLSINSTRKPKGGTPSYFSSPKNNNNASSFSHESARNEAQINNPLRLPSLIRRTNTSIPANQSFESPVLTKKANSKFGDDNSLKNNTGFDYKDFRGLDGDFKYINDPSFPFPASHSRKNQFEFATPINNFTANPSEPGNKSASGSKGLSESHLKSSQLKLSDSFAFPRPLTKNYSSAKSLTNKTTKNWDMSLEEGFAQIKSPDDIKSQTSKIQQLMKEKFDLQIRNQTLMESLNQLSVEGLDSLVAMFTRARESNIRANHEIERLKDRITELKKNNKCLSEQIKSFRSYEIQQQMNERDKEYIKILELKIQNFEHELQSKLSELENRNEIITELQMELELQLKVNEQLRVDAMNERAKSDHWQSLAQSPRRISKSIRMNAFKELNLGAIAPTPAGPSTISPSTNETLHSGHDLNDQQYGKKSQTAAGMRRVSEVGGFQDVNLKLRQYEQHYLGLEKEYEQFVLRHKNEVLEYERKVHSVQEENLMLRDTNNELNKTISFLKEQISHLNQEIEHASNQNYIELKKSFENSESVFLKSQISKLDSELEERKATIYTLKNYIIKLQASFSESTGEIMNNINNSTVDPVSEQKMTRALSNFSESSNTRRHSDSIISYTSF